MASILGSSPRAAPSRWVAFEPRRLRRGETACFARIGPPMGVRVGQTSFSPRHGAAVVSPTSTGQPSVGTARESTLLSAADGSDSCFTRLHPHGRSEIPALLPCHGQARRMTLPSQRLGLKPAEASFALSAPYMVVYRWVRSGDLTRGAGGITCESARRKARQISQTPAELRLRLRAIELLAARSLTAPPPSGGRYGQPAAITSLPQLLVGQVSR